MLESIQTLEGHTDRVWTLAWNPAGTILATSGADKTIRLWAREKSEKWICVSILTESHSKSIRRLCWSPCGNYLASASFDSTVCIWNRQTASGSWSTVVNLEGHESEVKSVAWSSDGKYLASCGRDRTIWIWERATDDNEDGDDSAANWDCSDVKNDHSKDVKHIVWHPQHPILASCSYDDTVKLFHKEGDDWLCFETLNVHTSTVWSADFSATGEHLVTCSDDKTVRVWRNHSHHKLPLVETDSWKCISVIQGYHSRSIYDVSWSNLSDVFATASGDNSIAIYKSDISKAEDGCDMFICIDKLAQAHDCDVNCIAWNPMQQGLLASSGDDRKVKLWIHTDIDKGMRPKTVIEELMNSLSRTQIETNIDSSSPKESQTEQLSAEPSISLSAENFQDFAKKIRTIQRIDEEINRDIEKAEIGGLLDLKFDSQSLRSLKVSNAKFDDQGDRVLELVTEVVDESGAVAYIFKILLDKFTLRVPKRSSMITAINDDLFLLEKTGELYQLLPTGDFLFLLGHLFIFSDVQFITERQSKKLIYIVSADRDEKVRISNFPDAHNIERFCFGHKSFLRRLIVVNETKFVSVDQQNEICVWNLKGLKSSQDVGEPLFPEKILSLDESVKKRICTR